MANPMIQGFSHQRARRLNTLSFGKLIRGCRTSGRYLCEASQRYRPEVLQPLMSLPKESVFKRRALWWLNPWIIGLAIVMLLVGIPMVLWLATYKSVPAVVMFSVTYLS